MKRAICIAFCLLALVAEADDKVVIRNGAVAVVSAASVSCGGKACPAPPCPDARAGTAVLLRLMVGGTGEARLANAEAKAWLKQWQDCGGARP